MNRNVVGIILIVIAIIAVAFFAWPRLKPYFSTPTAPGGANDMTTAVI